MASRLGFYITGLTLILIGVLGVFYKRRKRA
ncbi:MAG: LPXTG cell wall anchor domain-containing protein [Clostridiales bacterium]|nr:LPXTG cell wall anchor domain-containing protein [Clostridiales bacterium]